MSPSPLLGLAVLLGLPLVGCAEAPIDDDLLETGGRNNARDAGADDDDDDTSDGSDDADDAPAPEGRRDAGRDPERDASAADADAGSRREDAGVAARDAATARDAGEPDAAPSPLDAGAPRSDAGSSMPRDAGGPGPVLPDAGTGCVPGTYTGVFNGDISALFGIIHIAIQGNITIGLHGIAGGDTLEVRNGSLRGSDQSGNPLEARITGRLNCRTKLLEDSKLLDGAYTRRDPIWGGPPTTIGFAGIATGTFYDGPPSAQGRWEVLNERGTRGGSGTWTARLEN